MPFAPLPDGERLFYEEHGRGEPVLLVSGLFGRASFWPEPLIAGLSARYRVVTYDHRGVGASSRSSIRYCVAQMADDACALCDALELPRVHFIGHSLGGAIGQEFAICHPGRLDRLILSATWPGPDAYFVNLLKLRRDMLDRSDWDLYERFAALFMRPSWWIRDHGAGMFETGWGEPPDEPTRRIMLDRIDAVIAFDRRPDLARVQAPTLVVGARDDTWTPAYFTVELGQRIAQARTLVLPDGQHFFPQIYPEPFLREILAFLEPG